MLNRRSRLAWVEHELAPTGQEPSLTTVSTTAHLLASPCYPLSSVLHLGTLATPSDVQIKWGEAVFRSIGIVGSSPATLPLIFRWGDLPCMQRYWKAGYCLCLASYGASRGPTQDFESGMKVKLKGGSQSSQGSGTQPLEPLWCLPMS